MIYCNTIDVYFRPLFFSWQR